jgi:hypothetical protein
MENDEVNTAIKDLRSLWQPLRQRCAGVPENPLVVGGLSVPIRYLDALSHAAFNNHPGQQSIPWIFLQVKVYLKFRSLDDN